MKTRRCARPVAVRAAICLASTAHATLREGSSGVSMDNRRSAAANRVPPAEAIANDSTNDFIVVNPPTGGRFYRLAQ